MPFQPENLRRPGTVDGPTSWRSASGTAPSPLPFKLLQTGPLADAGTVPLFDLEHDQTAWFYKVRMELSEAHLHPAPMTLEQDRWFSSDRAVLDTYEKRAIAHCGELLRLWPQHSDVQGLYSLVCAPTTVTWNSNNGVILDLAAAHVNGALPDAIAVSARMNTTVLVAQHIDRMYLDR